MATVTIRPNASGTLSPNVTLTGAASQHAAVNDNSDASYLEWTAGVLGTSYATFDFDTFTLPARSIVVGISGRARARRQGTSLTHPFRGIELWNANVDDKYLINYIDNPYDLTDVITTRSFIISFENISQSTLDTLWLVMKGSGKTGDNTTNDWWRLYELYLDIQYNEAPVATVTGPAEAAVVVISRPTVTWTYSDPEGDTQERYWAKIFTLAQYTAPGFDPDLSTAYWSSGDTVSATTSAIVGTDLLSGVTYRVYVKVGDVGSSGRYGAWDNNTFSVALEAPGPPTITSVTVDNPNAKVTVVVQGVTNMLSENQASLETDTTGWILDNACTISRVTTAGSFAHGIAALQMAATGAAARARTTPVFDVTANKQYTFVASIKKATAGTKNGRVVIRWFQSDGTTPASTASNTGSNTVVTNASHVQAFVTATAPANAAKAVLVVEITDSLNAESYWVDKIGGWPGATTVWTRGGFASTFKTILERSEDAGATYEEVRGATAASPATPDSSANQVTTIVDHEAQLNVSLLYRAKSTVTY